MWLRARDSLVTPDRALPGRPDYDYPLARTHEVLGTAMLEPFPPGVVRLYLGMGCFWGAEKRLWQLPGVHTTAVGYQGGTTPHPTYREVCTGMTGHAEMVLVAYDPEVVGTLDVLRMFWENHDPTQGMRQGNDVGTQYRSGIYVSSDAQREAAEASRDAYAERLAGAGYGEITTEIVDASELYYAEDYHQQYLAKNPNGYCNHGFCQVAYG